MSSGPWLSNVAPANQGFASLGRARPAPGMPTAASFGSPGYASTGSGMFTGSISQAHEERTFNGEPGVTLNLVNVSIAQAAKTIFGDLLGMNFVVDDRVQGTVTVQTTSPVSKAALVDIFETVLRSHGAAIVPEDGFNRIVPADDARARLRSRDSVPEVQPGLGIEIVPLAYVSADEMANILQPIAPSGGIVRIDSARNLLMVAGTASELAAIRDTIAVFDVDWMKGMSFALKPLQSAQPEEVVGELQSVFQTGDGPGGKMLRFIPNKRLNAVLVIASSAEYLRQAVAWIDRLDGATNAQAQRLVVYPTRNRRPSELAPIIKAVFGKGQQAGPSGAVAPSLQPVDVGTSSGDLVAGAAAPTQATGAATSDAVGDSAATTLTIVPDDTDGSLLVYASPAEHRRIAALLAQIDRMPKQVLLEATIAEVTLNDELKFGLRWYFEHHNFTGRFTDTLGALAGVVPGFSFLYSGANVQVALTALADVTDVKIVSSPTLMVLDNQEARLQVGDEVPTVTQQAQSVTDPGAPVVNSVVLRDTGVILHVRPHINEGGRVTLEIQQEVSDVVPTTTSGIDSPTIRQRKLDTTVVVGDGESLALGGLIQDRNEQSRAKVPVLGDVPLLGAAFRRKADTKARTELIVFIQPHIVYDVEEARMITEEFRSQLSIQAPEDRSPAQTIVRDTERALH